jgi:hypothetical protein
VEQLRELVSADPEAELDAFVLQRDDTPSEAELRVMQAQLTGWLQGLFHGIQASMAQQQLLAQQQLARTQQEGDGPPRPGRGQYL